ncbi:MAG: 50S ribosomal protein L11 methyltransferase [Gammaproteobacteria bacterium]|nr:50S ribosomal protein L11 methyltransferase [Gammaproteobacteria bacterium]
MSWQQLHLLIPSEQTELFENALLGLGALSITLQDAQDEPIFEPELGTTPLWSQTKLTALFDLETDLKKVIAELAEQFPDSALVYELEHIADQVWERAWLKYFKPLQFGERLWICPSGYDLPDPKAVNIMLDPGLAFGTGTHPTTALCLEWLATHEVHNKTMMDYGCGSGILAIAAMKLGARECWAIDHDPQALQATSDNAQRNQISKRLLHLGHTTDVPPGLEVDILVANILAQPLIDLVEVFAHYVKPNGHIILSGILVEQAELIKTAYAPFCSMLTVVQNGDWLRIDGKIAANAKLT